ncbi:MAG TPA: tyrosine-type recombinase/integrase [Protaetiibacter sp.]|nr:tyrosine-type recombinase/integrase [Protaetiibacter sp.]
MASFVSYTTERSGRRWRVWYKAPDGRRAKRSGFKTKREAVEWYERLTQDFREGTYSSETQKRTLVGECLDSYFAAALNLAPATRANWESVAKNWVYPDWARREVGSVKSTDVEEWLARIMRAPREITRGRGTMLATAGAPTAQRAVLVLQRAFVYAIKAGLIHRNPALGVTVPDIEQHEALDHDRDEGDGPPPTGLRNPYLTFPQLLTLANSIHPRYRLLVFTLGTTGMRFSEAAALRKRNVDVVRNRIYISRAVTEVKGQLYVGPVKNRRPREVPIPAPLRRRLAERLAELGPDDLLFPSADGKHLRIGLWRRRYFYPALQAANAELLAQHLEPIPPITPHGLRHTAASLAVQSGANPLLIQRMLGHQNITMTMNRYADLFNEDLNEVSDKMAALFDQKTMEAYGQVVSF